MKTIKVRDADGNLTLDAEDLGSLRVEVRLSPEICYRFDCVITRLYQGLPDLTHKTSGSRICGVQYRHIMIAAMAAANRDVKAAAKLAFNELVEKQGADRVAAVLQAAELKHGGSYENSR